MIVDFSANMKVLVDFTTDRTAIAKAISKLKIGDGTAIYDAVSELFREKLSSFGDPSSIVLLSDGIDTVSSKSNYLASLMDAERGNANIFPVFFDTFNDPLTIHGDLPFGTPASLRDNLPTTGPGTTKEESEGGVLYLNQLIRLSGEGELSLIQSQRT